MAIHEPRLTADTVESPLPRDRHDGFGERSGETGREQPRYRAPGLLNSVMSVPILALIRFNTARNAV